MQVTSATSAVAALFMVIQLHPAQSVSTALRGSFPSTMQFHAIGSNHTFQDMHSLSIDADDDSGHWGEASDTTAPPPDSQALKDVGFELGVREDLYMIDCAEFAGGTMPSLQDKPLYATRVGSLINYTTTRELYLGLNENSSDCRAVNFIGKILIQQPGNYTFILKAYGQAVLRMNDTVIVNKTNITKTSKAGNYIVESQGGIWLGLDYYNQGPTAKVVLKYIGPDTNFEKKTVPPDAFEHRIHPKDQATAAPATTAAAPVAAASTAAALTTAAAAATTAGAAGATTVATTLAAAATTAGAAGVTTAASATAAAATTAGPATTAGAAATTAASATAASGLLVQPTASPATQDTIAPTTATPTSTAAAVSTAAALTPRVLLTTTDATPPPP